jgi:hypothetical protein
VRVGQVDDTSPHHSDALRSGYGTGAPSGVVG